MDDPADLRVIGVAVQLVLAVALLVVGGLAARGPLRPRPVWDRWWGRAPRLGDGLALALLGLGVGCWAVTQAFDIVPLPLQLGAIGVVLLGGVAVIIAQARVPDAAGDEATEDSGAGPTTPGPATGTTAAR